VEEIGLSALAHGKILRVARTIADVAGDNDINEIHLRSRKGTHLDELEPRRKTAASCVL
jgi:hypothetical protein